MQIRSDGGINGQVLYILQPWPAVQSVGSMKTKSFLNYVNLIKIVVLVCTTCLASSAGQSEELKFDRVINTGSLLCPGPLIQDVDGFLWVGTQGSGLLKYDGYSVKRYNAGPGSIADDNVIELYEDSEGLIWIGTMNGLSTYSKETDTFTTYRDDPSEKDSISSSIFHSTQTIVEDREGYIWVGTSNGLNRFDKKTGRFKRYLHTSDSASLDSSNIYAVYVDNKGFLWVGTDNGLNKSDKDIKTFTRYAHVPDDPNSITKGTVSSIYQDKSGIFWIGTADGLSRYDEMTGLYTRYVHDPGNIKSIPGDYVRGIYEDSLNRLWLSLGSIEGYPLTLFHKDRDTFVSYPSSPKDLSTPSTNSVAQVCGGISDIIWISHLNGALDKHDKLSRKFISFQCDPDDDNTISDTLINTSYEDVSGTIWFAADNGLNRYNRITGTFTRYMCNSKDPKSIPGNFVCGPYEDSQGNFWVLSSDHFISLFDRNTGTVTASYETASTPISVIEDKTDTRNLWIVSWGDGLAQFNKENHETIIISTDPNDPGSIGSRNIAHLYQDSEGIIWVPTMGGGLDKFDPRTGKVLEHYKHDPKDPASIGSNSVSHIFKDSSGTFWVGTYGGGLNKFNEKDGTFERYTEDKGFPTNSVTNILEDYDGNLWLGSKIGYIRFNPKTGASKVYTVDDGLAGNEFQEAAVCKSRDGTFWLATITGASSFHPGSLTNNPHPPHVFLTAVKQGGEDMHLGKAPERVKKIELDWQRNFFEFEFSALNYTKPEKNQYQYMLEGLDNDWYNAGNKRFGRYSGLPGGEYTLRIRGSNNDGLWCKPEQEVALSVVVGAPIWKKAWFYSISSLILIGSIGFLYTQHTRKRKREEEILRKNVENFTKAFMQNSIPMTISTVKEGRYIEVSEAFLEWIGQNRDKVVGNTYTGVGFINSEQRELILKEFAEKGRVENLELQVNIKGKEIGYGLFNATKIQIANEDYLLTIVTDITERKKAEDEKLQLEAQLMQSQKVESIGTLAGGIAHDFNNILSAIIGYTQLAMDDVSKPDKARKELGEVLKASDRAKNLVSQILTFSRKADVNYTPISLPQIIMDSIKMMRSVLPTTIDIRHDLLDHGLVMADPTQIHQVMMNLSTNAAHAMDKTGGVIEIKLQRVDADSSMLSRLQLPRRSYLWLSVSDTGHGMTPEVMSRIFDPYYTTKEVGRGTGLGLAVVHGIVQSHGGSITCTSSPGQGTVFDIYLPEILSEKTGGMRLEESPLPTGSERILFVDDEPALVNMAQKMLSRLGYTVVTRSSSLEALELFQEEPYKYDLVITDMTMPVMTGDILAQKIMEIRNDIPVILCSGYSEHITEVKAKKIGIREFVMKPFGKKGLAETIRKVLDGR